MPPKKKPKKAKKPAAAQSRRPNAALQAELTALRRKVNSMRVAPAPRRRMDPLISRYVSCVLNPFSGPLSRGLTTDRALPQTNVVRRLNTFQLNLTAVSAAALSKGVELAIVLNDARDPYAAVATNLAGTPTVTYIARDTNTSADYSIPLSSYARVIAAGVKITYLGSKLKQGGMWYHFPYDRETGGVVGIQFDNTWGAGAGEFSRAISSVGVTSRPVRFHSAPEVGFAPVNVKSDTLLNAGLPDTSEACSVMRLHWIGDAEACNFNIEVAEVLEYFHVSHRHYASTGTNHPAGPAVQQALAAHMQKPASGNSSPEHSGGSFISKALGVVQSAALGVLGGAANFVGGQLLNKLTGSSTSRASMPIIELVEDAAPELAMMAL